MEVQIELDQRKMLLFTSFAVHRLRKEKKFSTFFTLSPPTPMLTSWNRSDKVPQPDFSFLHGILKLPSHVSHSVLLAVSAKLQSGDGRTESQGWIHKVGRTGGF